MLELKKSDFRDSPLKETQSYDEDSLNVSSARFNHDNADKDLESTIKKAFNPGKFIF